MTGHGTSYGAVSVVNAIPCGMGATIGIRLKSSVTYEETGDRKEIDILRSRNMNKAMARICVKKTLESIHTDRSVDYKLTIDSQIPPSRGLKSSSSVCNAIISAVLDEHGIRPDPMRVIKLGVECAREANVTVTGAFDDACGCHLGGLVFTDNRRDRLLERREIPQYDVVLLISGRTIGKSTVPVMEYSRRKNEMREVLALAHNDPLKALTANGRIVADIIGMDTAPIDRALELGALAAGVTGTGPAIAIITEKGKGKALAGQMGERYMLSRTR